MLTAKISDNQPPIRILSEELTRIQNDEFLKSANERYNAYKRILSTNALPIDITKEEKQYLAFCINIAAGEKDKLTSLTNARKHLKDLDFLNKSEDCFRGWVSHNPKMLDSTRRGQFLRLPAPISGFDPHVYSDNITRGRTQGYAQNGSRHRIQKWLFTEFYFQGRITSLALELAGNNKELCTLLVSLGLPEKKLGVLKQVAKNTLKNGIPERPAGNTQIIVEKVTGESVALSPISSQRVQTAIQQLLSKREYYRLGQALQVGSGIDSPTCGNAVADSGGKLRFLRAIDRDTLGILRVIYHQLQCGISPLEKIDIEIADEIDFRAYRHKGTGEARAYLDLRQSKILRRQMAKIVKQCLRRLSYAKRQLNTNELWYQHYERLRGELDDKRKELAKSLLDTEKKKLYASLYERVLMITHLLGDKSFSGVVGNILSKGIVEHIENEIGMGLPVNIKKYVLNDCVKLARVEVSDGK